MTAEQNTNNYLKESGIDNDRDMLTELHAAFESEVHNCERCGHAEPTSTFDSASMLRDYLAANPVSPRLEWSDGDMSLPEDQAIRDAHPLKTRDFQTYTEALRLVSAKHSKFALVDLVNWLLSRIDR